MTELGFVAEGIVYVLEVMSLNNALMEHSASKLLLFPDFSVIYDSLFCYVLQGEREFLIILAHLLQYCSTLRNTLIIPKRHTLFIYFLSFLLHKHLITSN